MKLPRLQYITDSVAHAEAACVSGIRWIQGRVKNKPGQETKKILADMQQICKKHNCLFIVNDFLEIALEINADGVHLGKTDTSISAARNMIGNKKLIIGGTANTYEDIQYLIKHQVNYIGLGPFRFTTTKEQLSPVLGIEGYKEIFLQMKQETNDLTPVFAIGGITPEDTASLLITGVYGVAVSGCIKNSENKKKTIQEFEAQFNQTTHAG